MAYSMPTLPKETAAAEAAAASLAGPAFGGKIYSRELAFVECLLYK